MLCINLIFFFFHSIGFIVTNCTMPTFTNRTLAVEPLEQVATSTTACFSRVASQQHVFAVHVLFSPYIWHTVSPYFCVLYWLGSEALRGHTASFTPTASFSSLVSDMNLSESTVPSVITRCKDTHSHTHTHRLTVFAAGSHTHTKMKGPQEGVWIQMHENQLLRRPPPVGMCAHPPACVNTNMCLRGWADGRGWVVGCYGDGGGWAVLALLQRGDKRWVCALSGPAFLCSRA